MPDLDERFRGVDRVPVPDEWASIETRQVRSDLPSTRRRVGVVVLALALSIATTAVAIVAFDRVGDDRTVSTQTIANGLILYTADSPSTAGSKFDNVDLFSFDPATGERTNLTQTPLATEEYFTWSPDMTKVAFQRTQVGDRDSSMIVVADADLSDQRIIKTCNGSCSFDMAWSPDDGRIAWTRERRLDGGNYVESLELYDLGSGTTSVICDSRSCGFPGQPAWSPDGSRIAFSGAGAYHMPGYVGPTGPIRIADVASGAVTTLTGSGEPCNMERDGCASDTSPEWSPSGESLADVHEVRGGTSEATTQVMVVAANGSDPRVLTTCVSNDQCRQGPLAWSPDGRSVAFVDRYDHPVLHLLDPSGEGDVSIALPPAAGSPFDQVWSPDGRQLAFLSGDSGAQLFLVDVDTREVRAAGEPLPGGSGGDLTWLPMNVLASPIDASTAPAKPANTQPSPAQVTGEVQTVPHLSPFPNAVALGEGGVWISAPRNDGSGGGSVVRLDPTTAEIVARIPVDHLPGWETGGGGLAAGEGSVWSMGSDRVDGAQHTIVDRIDPSTNRMVEQIDLGAGSVGDVWASDGNLWAVRFTDVPNTLEVDRFDLSEDLVAARIPIPGEWSQEIFVYKDTVWVSALTAGSDDAFGGPGSQHLLIRIDAATDRYVEDTACGCGESVPSGGVIWTAVGDELHRLDAVTGLDLGSPAANTVASVQLIPDGEGGLWRVGSSEDGAKGTFEHLDAQGQMTDSGSFDRQEKEMWGGVAGAFDPSTNSLWFVQYEDSASVVRIH